VAYVLKTSNGVVDIARGELVQLLVVSKYDNGDIDLAEDSQLKCLLEQTTLALEESSTDGAR